MSAPLLFLSHAADRSGPSIYLRHFLRWLRSTHPDVDFEIALLQGGELEDDFKALAPTTSIEVPPAPWTSEQRANVEEARRTQMRQHAGAHVVHVNSAPSAALARLLPPGDRVLLSHVHELEIGLDFWLRPEDRGVLLGDASSIFVPAQAVAENLVANHGISAGRIAVHPEMVDVREVGRPFSPEDIERSRAARGLPVDGLIVGTGGTVYWRKAFDLFLRLAWSVSRRPHSRPVSFLWVGGEPGAIGHANAMAEDLGVADVVRFITTQPDPLEWFRLMDVFVLPAREDPFPLVCLEAASVGAPIVAFDNGGMPELLDQGCGVVVPYPDVPRFAAEVDALLLDGDRRRALGARGVDLIQSGFDVSHLAPKLWADIERWLP